MLELHSEYFFIADRKNYLTVHRQNCQFRIHCFVVNRKYRAQCKNFSKLAVAKIWKCVKKG